MSFATSSHCKSRAHCSVCRTDALWRVRVGAPSLCPHGMVTGLESPVKPKAGLGDLVATVLKKTGIGPALSPNCYDENKNLKPLSPCGKRKQAMNALLQRP